MSLISLLIIILVMVVVIWLFSRYVVPAFPDPIGKVALAILVLILIIILLSVTGILDLGSVRIR